MKQRPPAGGPIFVVIDGRAVARRQIGGVERYAIEMARRLPALAPGRYALAVPRPRLAHRAGHVWEQAVLPVLARGALVYGPANLAPLAARAAVVIHDLAPLRFPAAYSGAYVAYQRVMLALLARRARLITVSEFSRGELVALLGVDPARVAVVPGGVGERYTPSADAASARAALRLPQRYALAVGTLSSRKDLPALSEAARALRSRGVELILAGGERGYLRGDAPGLRRLGYVPERLMPGLLAGACLLVMPSRYEGFGLPCLEAMACATPVVATTAGALPEVCGHAAVLVAPGDRAALAGAAEALATPGPVRDQLIERGLARAGELTWARAARATDAVLERASRLAA